MKSKFAGLASARMKALQTEEAGEAPAAAVELVEPKPQKKAVRTSGNPDTWKPRKPAVGKSGKAEAQRSRKPPGTAPLSINVPEEKRLWWSIQARLQGTTVTEAVIEAMDKRFGLPKKLRAE
jgi:hypothetical protein